MLIEKKNEEVRKQKLKDMMVVAQNCMDKEELQILYIKLRKFWADGQF